MTAIEAPQRDTLPAAYAPFLGVLDRLSEPLRQILCGQLLQFERFLHLADRESFAAAGEFEGLGGLTHRGDIAQIVQSELLLREHAPLEFLRRLAEAETLYHEKRYADPGERHVYRVMLSMGPGVLGHGRLLALAALFYVARVALARDAAFAWTMLPRNGTALWIEGIDLNSVKSFLHAASHREMSAQDAADAIAAWDEAAGAKRHGIEPVDWVIGAAEPRGSRGTPLAVRKAVNALTFDLSPPAGEQPRILNVAVRQHGWERARVPVTLPDDRVCVSALTDPFRPFRPAPGGGGVAPPRSTGWEQEHLTSHHHDRKVIRLANGLLILQSLKKAGFINKLFVPIPPDVTIAGVDAGPHLHLLLNRHNEAGEKLTQLLFRLAGVMRPEMIQRQQHVATAEHLFRKRSPHALASLLHDRGVNVWAASGQQFYLSIISDPPSRLVSGNPIDDRMMSRGSFSPVRNAPKIVHATGPYRVVRAVAGGQPKLEVYKRGSLVDSFAIPEDFPERPRNIVYSGSERSLACCVTPESWLVLPPSFASGAPPRTIAMEPGETLLTARWSGDDVLARIWSDARYGGTGSVLHVRQVHGTRVNGRRPPLRLGEDALAIARIEIADDGIWAVTVDEQGWPVALLHYRFWRRSSRYDCTRYDLAELERDSRVLDLEPYL